MADSPTLLVADPCMHGQVVNEHWDEPLLGAAGLCPGGEYRPASRSEILSAARTHLDYEAAAGVLDGVSIRWCETHADWQGDHLSAGLCRWASRVLAGEPSKPCRIVEKLLVDPPVETVADQRRTVSNQRNEVWTRWGWKPDTFWWFLVNKVAGPEEEM